VTTSKPANLILGHPEMDHSSPPVVLSIRPTFIQRILEGSKTVELRRRFPSSPGQRTVLFYSSAPVQAIVGHGVLEEVKQLALSTLWRRFSAAAAVTRAEFDAYFTGATMGCALLLREIRSFPEQIHLSVLTRQFDFSPPQSYCYWRESLPILADTGHDGVKVPT
jgi:predicted transcriptional regulator